MNASRIDDLASMADGTIRRKPSVFRGWVTPDGEPVDGGRGFSAAANRYHLYVSLACPWAHRTLIMRILKGLENVVGLSVVHWRMGEDGWTFEAEKGVVEDVVNGVNRLHELYTIADATCTSRVSVPVLWDEVEHTIVSNESADIIRMFNSAFDEFGASVGDYYPPAHRREIDAINERVLEKIMSNQYAVPLSPRGLAGRPIVNMRHFPRLAAGQHDNPAVHELVMSIMDNPKMADAWTGEGQLTLPVAEGEEISDLAPVRVGAGYRVSMSYTVTDLKTLVDGNQSRQV